MFPVGRVRIGLKRHSDRQLRRENAALILGENGLGPIGDENKGSFRKNKIEMFHSDNFRDGRGLPAA